MSLPIYRTPEKRQEIKVTGLATGKEGQEQRRLKHEAWKIKQKKEGDSLRRAPGGLVTGAMAWNKD